MTRIPFRPLAVAALLISATLALGVLAPARAVEGVEYGVTAGGTFPVSNLAEVVAGGFNIGVTVYKRLTPLVDLGLDIDAHFLGGTDDFEKQLTVKAGMPVNYNATIIPLSFYGRYRVPVDENIVPFLKLGAGIYTIQNKVDVGVFGDEFKDATRLGLDFGGGVDLQMTPTLILGADLMYHWFDTSPEAGQMIVMRVVALFGSE